MGTNFYWRYRDVTETPTGDPINMDDPDFDRMDPTVHLGKRSAASWYCWDCDETLCRAGRENVHGPREWRPSWGRAEPLTLQSIIDRHKREWYDRCPKCGQEPIKEPAMAGGVAVELGFAEPERTRPTGVRGVCSFTWAQDPEVVGRIMSDLRGESLVVNEYGDEYTAGEFLDMLANNCPIQFTDSVNKWFG